MIKKAVFSVCLAVLLFSMMSVILLPGFKSWERKDVARYYIENAAEETGSANTVASIVWDYRGFDTFGEETVLFTAAVGVFTVIVFGLKLKRDMVG